VQLVAARISAPASTARPHLKSPIREVRPGYCGGCGKPFPWTEAALSATKEYADELDQLSPKDRKELKGTFDDLAGDTARTPLAAGRFKKLMIKVGPVGEGVLKKFLETVVTEAAKKMMGL